MVLYPVDDLDDALDATRAFLLPFDRRRWLRLAVLAFFVAGGVGGASPPTGVQFDGGAMPGDAPFDGAPVEEAADALASNLGVVLAVAAVAVVLALAFAWLSATFEFALLDALRTDDVRVRAGLREHAGRGTRLFAFRLALGVVGLAVAAAVVLAALAPLVANRGAASVVAVLALIPVFVVLGLVFGLVNAFTTAFVAPIMLLEDRGVLAAWRRLWPVVRRDWKQFAAFAVVGFVLTIAVGIVVGLAGGVIFVAFAIPFAVVAGVVVFSLGGLGPASLLALGVVGAILGLLALVAVALVQVPVQSYLRYWALLVLGDVDSDLDLVPERRADVRSEGDGTASEP